MRAGGSRSQLLRSALVAGLATVALGSCVQDSRYRPVDRGIDRAFVYSERGRDGKAHGISDAADPNAQKPARVPAPALVDIDSTLVVRVDPEWGANEQGQRDEAAQTALLARKAELTLVAEDMDRLAAERAKILAKIEARGYVEKGDFDPIDEASKNLTYVFQGLAAQAYGLRTDTDPELVWTQKVMRKNESISDEAKRKAANKQYFLDHQSEIELFEDSPEYEELDAARQSQGFAGRQTLLTRELEKLALRIAEADRKLERAATTSEEGGEPMIRLRADLERPGVSASPLHLRGYDNLDEGQLQQRDRAGLNLSEAERQDLAEQMEATQELSAALEDIRTRELTFQAGLMRVLEVADPELHGEAVKLQAAVTQLQSPDLLARLTDATKKLQAFLEAEATRLEAELSDELKAMPETLAAKYEGSDTATGQILKLAADIEQLRRDLDEPQTPESITSLLGSTGKIAEQAGKLVKDEALLDKLAAEATAEFEAQGTGLEGKALELWNTVKGSEQAKAFKAVLKEYSDEFQIAKDATLAIYKNLAPTQFAAESVLSNPTHVFDVPADELRDTFLDLTRVETKPGDRIVIRAQQREGDEVVDESEASFEITRYGWWGRLSPSVVLVKPTSLANGGETFQFAPALSWNQHYRPRPDQHNEFDKLARFLEPAIGIHAAFLPYDSVNGIAIGMGATVSFWEDHLQVGGGYNLMASNSGEGEFYYFIGSDLIGLLQALNIGD